MFVIFNLLGVFLPAAEVVPQPALTTEPGLGSMPPPAPRGVFRPTALTIGGGAGWLALHDNLGRDGEVAANAALRLSAALALDWVSVASLDLGLATRGDSNFYHLTPSVGVARFFGRGIYLRAGLGPSWVLEGANRRIASVGPGLALAGALGLEAARSTHLAAGIEALWIWGFFRNERWDTAGLALVLTRY